MGLPHALITVKWNMLMSGIIDQGPLEVGLFKLAQARLAWADQRQQVLAANIANADTPGWSPLDIQPFSKSLNDADLQLAQTERGDLGGIGGGGFQTITNAAPAARAPDGNAVSLDVQLKNIADTQTDQQFVTTIYKKYLDMFNIALDK